MDIKRKVEIRSLDKGKVIIYIEKYIEIDGVEHRLDETERHIYFNNVDDRAKMEKYESEATIAAVLAIWDEE